MTEVARSYRRPDVNSDEIMKLRDRLWHEEDRKMNEYGKVGIPYSKTRSLPAIASLAYNTLGHDKKFVKKFFSKESENYCNWPALSSECQEPYCNNAQHLLFDATRKCHRFFPPKVREEGSFSYNLCIFTSIKAFGNTAPFAVMVVGYVNDVCYPIAAFGDKDYLDKFEQALAEPEKPKEEKSKKEKSQRCPKMALVIGTLVGSMFVFVVLAYFNRWWPFQNVHAVGAKTQCSDCGYNDSWKPEVKQLKEFLSHGVTENCLQEKIQLSLDWKYCEYNNDKVISLKEKFPDLRRAELVHYFPNNKIEHQFRGKIRCYLENGDIYENDCFFLSYADKCSIKHTKVTTGGGWYKLPQY